MKFLHTADWHIGKRIFELSMIEDQKYILAQILEIACKEKVDAILIAGDVYDRALPPAEAVTLLDEFLTTVLEKKIPVIMISGNHDSPERLSFAGRILEKQGLYIAGNYEAALKIVTLEDCYGPIEFVCMPYVKPAVAGCQSNAQAVEKRLEATSLSRERRVRRVLLTHYFVLGEDGEQPKLSDSESDIQVGGLDSVPASCLQQFDYVALGHIHRAQQVGKGKVYYSGSVCKYSFKEALHPKSVTIVEMDGEGGVQLDQKELKPLHEMRCIRGKLADLISSEALQCVTEQEREDYLQVTLTDTEELIDPMGTLRSVYPNVLHIILEKHEGACEGVCPGLAVSERKATAQLFGEFYELLKGEPLDERRLEIVQEAAKQAEKQAERMEL